MSAETPRAIKPVQPEFTANNFSKPKERIIQGGLIVTQETEVGSFEHFKTLPKGLQEKIREADLIQQKQGPHI